MKKKIHINRLGYMTGMPKNAVCCVSANIFHIVDASLGISVYAGRLTHPFFDRESGMTVRIADFSDFNRKGTYFIRAGYRRSDVFEISDMPYKDIRRDIIHGIYLNRCGFDYYEDLFDGRVDGNFLRHACHTEPVNASGDPALGTDVSGGWHNSGCYCKNILHTGLAVATMIYSLRVFGESFDSFEKRLIEDEFRWGLDWMLKMQDSDGGIFSAVSALHGDDFISPEDDANEYYLDEKTCGAALRFTAVTALAAGYFADSDREYSKRLKRASAKSWINILRTPEYKYYSGKYGSFSENGEDSYALESDFMWAMCEMYSLTGDESYIQMFDAKYTTSSFTGFGNKSCGGFAALSYFLSEQKKDKSMVAFIRKRLTDNADRLCIAINQSGYRTACSAGSGYTYGSNFAVLNDCMDFITAYLISGEQKYLECATDLFSYIFGKNPMDICYITGNSEGFCENPYHSLSVSFENSGTLGGMIVGGPNSARTDEYTRWHIEKGAAPAVCYVDNEYSFSTNEAAVHFSAPVIFISAFYDKVGRSSLSSLKKPVIGIIPQSFAGAAPMKR